MLSRAVLAVGERYAISDLLTMGDLGDDRF